MRPPPDNAASFYAPPPRCNAHARFICRGRFPARVFQHELDHLDGIVYTEKALPRSIGHLSRLHTPALRDALRQEVPRDLPHASLSEAERAEWDSENDAIGFPF